MHQVVLYDPAKHLPDLLSWVAHHKIDFAAHAKMLPPTGLVIQGLCAGFLVLTNTPAGYVEPVIANPAADPKERDEALNDLGTVMWHYARELGCKHLLCYSQLPTVIDRALSHGWFSLGGSFTLLQKDL